MPDNDGAGSGKTLNFVRMGTRSSAFEKQQAQKVADAKKRRAIQDRQVQIAKRNPQQAMMKTARLGGKKTHATVILGFKHKKDSTIEHFMTCELIDHVDELILQMMCPRCVFTHGVSPDEAQMKLHQKNRKWEFVPGKLPWWANNNPIWVNPEDPREVLTIPGTINMAEWGYCPLCKWKFTIDDATIRTD